MAMSSVSKTFVHTVDANGVIVAVNGAWLAFALENDAPELNRENVVGRPLWDFISDKETRHVSRLLLDRAVATGKQIVIPFRCDAPWARRFLEMEIVPFADGTVEFRSRLLREEKRGPVALLDRKAERADVFIAICSWCRRVKIDGAWVEVDEAIRRMDLFSSPALPQLTHGICVDCDRLFMAKTRR